MPIFTPITSNHHPTDERNCTIKVSTVHRGELLATATWFDSLASYDSYIAFLNNHRNEVKQFFTKPEWTAFELLNALKAKWPRALIFHNRDTSILNCLAGNSRFYIYATTGHLYYSYGHCCRDRQSLDCPPEERYSLNDLLTTPTLIATQI